MSHLVTLRLLLQLLLLLLVMMMMMTMCVCRRRRFRAPCLHFRCLSVLFCRPNGRAAIVVATWLPVCLSR